jgi:hypothetical protein
MRTRGPIRRVVLKAVLTGRAIKTPLARAHGCTIKYARAL